MSKPSSIYAGGYTADKKATLQATKLPAKIRCKDCQKLKPNHAFSERQLGTYRQKLAKNPRLGNESVAIVSCQECTPAQVTELQCYLCDQYKSLDAFTKAQRRDPEMARCIVCVNQHLSETPTGAQEMPKAVGSDSEDDDDKLTTTNNYEETVSYADATSYAASNNEDDSDERPSAPNPRAARHSGAHNGNASSQRNPAWTAFAQQNASAFTAYDASGEGHRRVRNPSTAASVRSNGTTINRSNFAKTKSDQSKGVKGLIDEQPAAKEVGRQVYRDSSSDDDYGYI